MCYDHLRKNIQTATTPGRTWGCEAGFANSQKAEEDEGWMYISIHVRIRVGVGDTVHELFRNLSLKLDLAAACIG